MSTTTTLRAVDDAVPAAAVISRFVWKEFRMLRGLWLAVGILGLLMQWVSHKVSPPAVDQPMLLFSTALCAAVLYAVGAASTIFSVEHEEGTYDYLTSLPSTWWPLYVGKLIVVIVSVFALAAGLSVSGWVICDFGTRDSNDTRGALALFGVASLEAIAWGTLFSLLLKRPLVAAIFTLVVGGFVLNLLVNLTATFAVASLSPAAYAEAIPQRLGVAALVLVCSTLLARRWISVGVAADSPQTRAAGETLRLRVAARLWSTAGTARGERRSMLARLIWQTWRDSWKLLPLPIGAAAFLVLGIGALIGLSGVSDEVTTVALASSLLFVPALYGAMAFSADQRRESYRFLAEHGARPRYVWLARHIVWLGTLCLLFAAVVIFAAAMFAIGLRVSAVDAVERYVSQGLPGPEVGYAFERVTWFVLRTTTLGTCGMLAAYAVGQFCSMLMRSEILAAFAALVLSVVVSVWMAVLLAWDLNGWLFLLPLAVALMLATWLRAPDWIAGRNSWRTWIMPALLLLLALTIAWTALPKARLGQISDRGLPFTPMDAAVERQNIPAFGPEARETAEIYQRAVAMWHQWDKNHLLERWQQPEYQEPFGIEDPSDDGIDVTKIPPNEIEAYYEARQRQTELKREARAAALSLATQASARPTCHFNFDVRLTSANVPVDARWQWNIHSDPAFSELRDLLTRLQFIDPGQPFHRLLAALRMSAHLASGQPTVVFMPVLNLEQMVLRRVGEWAAHEGRTMEELQAALDELTNHFGLGPSLLDPLIADHNLVRDVVLGGVPSLAQATRPDSLFMNLAYLANQLSWERTRGLAALNQITALNISEANQLVSALAGGNSREMSNQTIRRWLRPRYGLDWPETWLVARPAAATSYLTRCEYQFRSPVHKLFRAYCDMETCRRAALQQIALAMFRRDHGEYPGRLSELVPNYLDSLPMDPYSGEPFQFEPQGVDLPLQNLNLDPMTPFLWSVGPGNARLRQSENTVWEQNTSDPERDRLPAQVKVYVVTSEERYWWGEAGLVFPLVK
jgi:hypothetical protein